MPKRVLAYLLPVLFAHNAMTSIGAEAETSVTDGWSPVQSGASLTKEDEQNSGNDFTRPLNSFELRLRYQPSSSPDSTTDKEYALLRATTRVDLDASWKVSLYVQTEALDKQTNSAKSGASQEAGLGDSTVQAVLIRSFGEEWAFGAGVRAVTPTASDDLGTGKLQIMPGLGVRYSFLELGPDNYFVPSLRYAVSVAGTHSTRDISELQIAPTLNLDLPGHWFLTLYPSYDIRINYGDPVSGQTGRLFLPADVELGYKLSDKIVLGLEGSVPIIRDYPVYDYKVTFRMIFKN
ncbi:MAG: transporter [Rhodomicrobium sp.]